VHFAHLANTLIRDEESARDNHVLSCNFAKYSPILNIFFNYRVRDKPFLIWLLTTPPDLKYVATLRCTLLLMACFADINVSQGSVATCASCGGTFNIHLTANLPRNLPVKVFKSVIFDRIMVMTLTIAFSAFEEFFLVGRALSQKPTEDLFSELSMPPSLSVVHNYD